MRRNAFVLFVLLGSAGALQAQIVRPRFQVSAPSVWVSGSYALQNAFSVRDGTTSSTWEFGSANMIGGSLEKAFMNGLSAGIRGSTGMVPLRYTGAPAVYDADARVSQVMGAVRIAPGQSFHTVLELGAGATYFSAFRSRADSTKLPPLTGDTDFTFSFGYGFGYAFNPRFTVDVVQDQVTTIHQKDGLAPSDDSSNRFGSTRIVARFGLGGK